MFGKRLDLLEAQRRYIVCRSTFGVVVSLGNERGGALASNNLQLTQQNRFAEADAHIDINYRLLWNTVIDCAIIKLYIYIAYCFLQLSLLGIIPSFVGV
jgi:hypothetical protein